MAPVAALLSPTEPPRLSPAMAKVVLHWGEMGARWGVNRSVAQVHALLWLLGRPIPAEDIAETLSIARSNVSTSLDELQAYRLVSLVHVIGDRRNRYQAEIDPPLDVLRAASAEADEMTPADVRKRMAEMAGFIERMTGWYDQMKNVPRPMLERMIRLGARIVRLLGK